MKIVYLIHNLIHAFDIVHTCVQLLLALSEDGVNALGGMRMIAIWEAGVWCFKVGNLVIVTIDIAHQCIKYIN